jgi:hypothetical protein
LSRICLPCLSRDALSSVLTSAEPLFVQWGPHETNGECSKDLMIKKVTKS